MGQNARRSAAYSEGVRVDPHSERLIEQQLRCGRYHSREEVVARALETLAESESTGADENKRRQAVEDMLEFADKHRFPLVQQGCARSFAGLLRRA